jgi:signal transduction histidine kinase
MKELQRLDRSAAPLRAVSQPGRIIIATAYLLFAAVVIRSLANPNIRARLPIYLGLEFLYLVLFSLVLWRPARRPLWQHAYFVIQSWLVLALILLRPRFDFILVLYVLLSLQAALVFSGRAGWIWVGILALLTSMPLMATLGALQGLALALMPMTIGIVFAAWVAVTQEIEAGLCKREELLVQLQEANQLLTFSACQAEELSAIQERDRLARELHDSVSQTIFSISLVARASQLLLERDPQRLRPQLEQLQRLTHNALAEMRGLIAQLRPPEGESAGRLTS